MRPVILLSLLTLAACGSTTTSGQPTVTLANDQATTTAVVADSPTTVATPIGEIVNVWTGAVVDPTALPLGTAHVSTAGPAIGDLFVCDAGNPNAGGAFVAGPWIDEATGTWDMTHKVSVTGEVEWPMAQYSETIDGSNRVIASNGLPVGYVTGEFPIAADDPAFQYDRNPNSIAETAINVTLPTSPVTGEAGCMPKGAVGVLKNGVAMFASIDALNRDAAAYETLDACDGHPQQQSHYHYHSIPSCIQESAVGVSTVVGYAFDGFPIVVERDASGALPTNADLDECHGRTSPIMLDGAVVEMYHYSATLEFPYFIGCFRGEPVA